MSICWVHFFRRIGNMLTLISVIGHMAKARVLVRAKLMEYRNTDLWLMFNKVYFCSIQKKLIVWLLCPIEYIFLYAPVLLLVLIRRSKGWCQFPFAFWWRTEKVLLCWSPVLFLLCGPVQSGGDLILFDNVMLWPSPGFTKISVEQCWVSESHETFCAWTENITYPDFAPIAHIYCGNVANKASNEG